MWNPNLHLYTIIHFNTFSDSDSDSYSYYRPKGCSPHTVYTLSKKGSVQNQKGSLTCTKRQKCAVTSLNDTIQQLLHLTEETFKQIRFYFIIIILLYCINPFFMKVYIVIVLTEEPL